MLRFLLISISTLAVLGTFFFLLVLRDQPAPVTTSTTQSVIKATPLSDIQSQAGVGPGKYPSLVNYDHGQLSSKFNADDFTPQKDGSFIVKNPVAIYYMGKGQWMKVTGDTGTMYCDTAGPTQSNNLLVAPTGTPRNGTLHRVRVELYPEADSTQPTQWMETDNIRFDNDTYRMYTESYVDANGNTIPADQVAVSIRGEQYEFDGNGLTMVWNGINHRLEKLEVAHGKRLEIKDTTKLALPGMAAPETAKAVAQLTPLPVPRERAGVRVIPIADHYRLSKHPHPNPLPAYRERGPNQLIADTKPLPKADPPTPYRAVFHDQVQIKDPTRTLATADLMTVDFLQGSTKPAPSTPTVVNNAATPLPHPVAAPTTAATELPSATTKPSTTKPATTKPMSGPITIYWTGRLVVQPIKDAPILPLSPGQSIVKLVGRPVHLTPEGSSVEASTAIYRNPDGAVQLLNSAAFPVVHLEQGKDLSATKKLTLDTAGINYDPAAAQALLTGPNELNIRVAEKMMNVTWANQGVLHVIRVPTQPNGVDQIDLSGDVVVKHPIFTLNSNRLKLNLDLLPRPGAKPTEGDEQLRLLTANDDVHCRLIHQGKPDEGIDGDQLIIRTDRTADKRTIPAEVIADGNVLAFDPDQKLTTDHLDALLVPKPVVKSATKPSDQDVTGAVDLDSLEANTNNVGTMVHAILKGGATADAKHLHITTVEGKKLVELSGDGGVKLDNQKGTWLTGPVVLITPDDSGLKVTGAGKMETIRTAATTQPASAAKPNPIDVTWVDSMSLQGSKNIADVYGNVVVTNIDAAGTNSSIRGDNAHIDLMDAPRPAKEDKKKPTTQPDAFGSNMGGKQVKALTLTGNVVGDSELHGPGGILQRQSNLFCDQLKYDSITSTATIPGPGKMLMENHRSDEKAGSSNRGNMAIAWDKKLTYNQTTQQIFIDGNTIVGFEHDNTKPANQPPPAPMQLRAQHLIITLEKVPNAGGDQNKLRLSKMNANGQVRFNANGANLTSDQVDYNPKDTTLTATGHGRTVDTKQNITGTFDSLIYDTVKEEVKQVKGSQVKVLR